MADFCYPFHGLLTHRRQYIHQEVLISVHQYSDFALATLLWLRFKTPTKRFPIVLYCLRRQKYKSILNLFIYTSETMVSA